MTYRIISVRWWNRVTTYANKVKVWPSGRVVQ